VIHLADLDFYLSDNSFYLVPSLVILLPPLPPKKLLVMRFSILSLLALPVAQSNYVAMPNGKYYHESCVHQYSSHFNITETPSHFIVDNEKYDKACEYAIVSDINNSDVDIAKPATSESRNLDNVEATYYSSWVAYASSTQKTTYTSLTSSFTVPPPPTDYKRITSVFLFNGLQDKPTGMGANYILQPVLQYGKSGCGGGNYWSIAAFYVSGSGRAYCGKTIKVDEGDVINANMTLSDDGWTIIAEDTTKNQLSSYTTTVSTPAIYGVITLEGIVVYNCGAFANTDETLFYNNVLEVDGVVIKPEWDYTVVKNECEQDVKIYDNGDVAILTPLHHKDDTRINNSDETLGDGVHDVKTCLATQLAAGETGMGFVENPEMLSMILDYCSPSNDDNCALQCTIDAIAEYWKCAANCDTVACITAKCVADVIAFDIPCLNGC
jgi:hypothetical protein